MNAFIKSKHGQRIDRSQDRVGKALRRSLLQRQVVTCAQARINGEGNGKRKRRFLVENRDRLLPTVFLKCEVIFLQSGNRSAVCIRNRDVDVYQLYVDL